MDRIAYRVFTVLEMVFALMMWDLCHGKVIESWIKAARF
jgi:hypothetical protein